MLPLYALACSAPTPDRVEGDAPGGVHTGDTTPDDTGAPHTGPSDTGPSDTGAADTGAPPVSAPCAWDTLPRPHWSLALPWLLADPALGTGIEEDLGRGTERIYGEVEGDGSFTITVEASEYSAFAAYGLSGSFDPATGIGAWTFSWEALNGETGARAVSAAWEGCTLVERYGAEVPLHASGIPSERRTTFDAFGQAWSSGRSDDTEYTSCRGDETLIWTSQLTAEGDLLASGSARMDDGYRFDTVYWMIHGGIEDANLAVTVSRTYSNCCCSVGTGGYTDTRVEVSASFEVGWWTVDQDWFLYDRDAGDYRYEGTGSLYGQSIWGTPAYLRIEYEERSFERWTGTGIREEEASCDGAWSADTGVSWECDVDTESDLASTWGVPPSLVAWLP